MEIQKKTITKYFDIVESLDKQIKNLGQVKLDSGILILEQATESPRKKRDWLIRKARNNFNQAITIEKKERLALAYLGLALCHSYLKYRNKCEHALSNIIKIRSSFNQKDKTFSGVITKDLNLLNNTKTHIKKEGWTLETLQTEIQKILNLEQAFTKYNST